MPLDQLREIAVRAAVTTHCYEEPNYMTARQYLRLHEPSYFNILLDKAEACAEGTIKAAKVAELLGEQGIRCTCDNLIAYRSCVWAVVYHE
jgi:hypothetical protein